jgi:hypothetical protein
LCVFFLSSEQISNNERKSQASSKESDTDNASKRRRMKVEPPSRETSELGKLRHQQQQEEEDFTHLAYQDNSDSVQEEEKITIDYMARDYASFRAALLDLIPRKIPQWKDKSEADMGIMLIELFSYIADELSYFQDRVANEAFLRTAKARSSVSNHLSLIDYRMQNGLSANAFIKVKVKKDSAESAIIPAGFQISTYPERGVEGARRKGESAGVITFETLEDQLVGVKYNGTLVVKTNEKKNDNNKNNNFDSKNSTATLKGRFPELKKGQHILLFQTDSRRNIITRQTIVKLAEDSKITDDGNNDTRIMWEKGSGIPEVEFREDGDVFCCANIVRASHGRTVRSEILKQKDQKVSKFLFTLKQAPLTFVSDPFSSSSSMGPRSTLKVWVEGESWEETDSLLKCGPLDQKFSISIDEDGYATILFGDGKFGLKPEDDSLIEAEYRVGSGSVGNVGMDTLKQFHDNNNYNLPHSSHALVQEVIDSVTNPLPATGGVDMESMDDAKIAGPRSLMTLERAVTLKDYEDLVRREFQNEITNARARFIYTGSWDTIFISVDLKGKDRKNAVDRPELFDRIRTYLDRVRMIGYEVQIEEAKYVPIEIGITIYLQKYFDSKILRDRIRSSLSNKDKIVEGTNGLFHPDNFTFGDPVYASKIYEVLKNTPEVKYGIITTFRKKPVGEPVSSKDMAKSPSSSSSSFPLRFPSPDIVIAQRDEDTKRNLELGYIPINENEIITSDTDPSHPENGILILNFVEDDESKKEGEEEDHVYGNSLSGDNSAW